QDRKGTVYSLLPLKCLLLAFIVLTLIFINPSLTMANDNDTPVFSWQETMSNLDIDVLENYKNHIDGEITSYLEQKSVTEWLVDFAKGNWQFDIQEVVRNILIFLFREIIANSSLLGKILILSVLAALLINLQTAFSSSVGKVSYLACFLALC